MRRVLSIMIVISTGTAGLWALAATGGAQGESACQPGAAGCSTFNFTIGHWGQPVVNQGEIFFEAINRKVIFQGGPVLLAGNSDGTADINVDDVLRLRIKKPDGTTRTFIHDFSSDCSGTNTPIPAQDVTSLFRRGVNIAHLRLQDKCGGGEGPLTGLWLVLPPT